MKITFGGSKKMTITNYPYEPIQVESVLLVEKEVADDFDLKSLDNLQEKVNNLIDKDLESKMDKSAKKQIELRNRIKNMTQD